MRTIILLIEAIWQIIITLCRFIIVMAVLLSPYIIGAFMDRIGL